MVDLHDLQFVMNKSVTQINHVLLDDFVNYLSQHGIHVDKTTVSDFERRIPNNYFQLVENPRRKDKKTQRTPNSYNMFIRDKMKEIKAINPSLTGKELLKHATQEWNKFKQQKNNLVITQEQLNV